MGVQAAFTCTHSHIHTCTQLQVWVVYGDGTVGYSIAEIDTFVRHHVRVVCVVGNDACWTQIAREQVPLFKTAVACTLARTPYEIVAEGTRMCVRGGGILKHISHFHMHVSGYGGEGLRLTEPGEVDRILAKAREIYKSGKPVLINAFIGTTNFRDGSISV
jgi:acetolactate synthase-like protein